MNDKEKRDQLLGNAFFVIVGIIPELRRDVNTSDPDKFEETVLKGRDQFIDFMSRAIEGGKS